MTLFYYLAYSYKFFLRSFSSYPNENKKLITVKGADHNNILVTDYPLYAEMAEWFLNGSL